MPIRKYRTIEEMNAERRWLATGDPAIPRKIRFLWELSERLVAPVGLCIPRGVRKYHSVEEAEADRQRWEQTRVDLIAENRKRQRNR